MTGPEYEAELEAFLKRRSPMHRRLSEIDHAEPSIEIDRLVLDRAREAIDTPSQPLFRNSRWALPVGLAAAILIAFTVVLNIDHRAANAALPVASNVSPAAEGPAPAAARAASVSEPARMDPPRVLSDSAQREQAEKKAATPAALAKRYEMPESPDAANASANSSHLLASGGALGSALTNQAPPASTTNPPGASAGVGAVPAAPPVSASSASRGAADPHSTPDLWLREINRLRAAGRTADADRELAAFRETYPSHPSYSVAKPPAR